MKPSSVHVLTIERFLTGVALVLAAIGASACDHSTTPTPIPTPIPALAPAPPGGAALSVVSVQPTVGFTAGGMSITLWGAGFAAGAIVTIGGSPVTITRVDSNQIEGTIPAHDAGFVDIAVTNRDGRSATLANRFTYVATMPAPQINRVSLGAGSTEGGTPLVVSGHDFFPGTTLTIGGVLTRGRTGSEAEGWSGSFIEITTPAHGAGRVDIVVTNPDGQFDNLPGGFEYVLPESLDFNGDWVVNGGDYGELEDLHVTIQHDIVVGISCDGKALTYSPLPSVEHGAFALHPSGGGSVSGRIVGPAVAIGTMSVAGCSHSGAWTAWKYESGSMRSTAALNLGFRKRTFNSATSGSAPAN